MKKPHATAIDTVEHLLVLIGPDATNALLRRFRGRTIHIPLTDRAHTWYGVLVEVVGAPAADKLIAGMGDTDLYVPRATYQLARARWKAIQDELDAGAKVNDLVEKFQVSDRWIYYVAKKDTTEVASPQFTLDL